MGRRFTSVRGIDAFGKVRYDLVVLSRPAGTRRADPARYACRRWKTSRSRLGSVAFVRGTSPPWRAMLSRGETRLIVLRDSPARSDARLALIDSQPDAVRVHRLSKSAHGAPAFDSRGQRTILIRRSCCRSRLSSSIVQEERSWLSTSTSTSRAYPAIVRAAPPLVCRRR